MTRKSDFGSAYQAPSEGRPPGGAAAEAPDGSLGFKALSAHLRSIPSRATTESWPGWSDDDRRAVRAAAREIETFEEALAQGMREAFAIGRTYGQREDLLDRLDREIAQASSRLAREAWGPGPGG